MRTIFGLENVEGIERSVLTVGNFDGVHLAHRALIKRALSLAEQNRDCDGAAADGRPPVVVLTFEPHPLTVVAPGRAPSRLTLPEEKLRLLAEAGADVTVVAQSEPSLLGMEAEQFVRDVLVTRFHPAHVVEGPSFGFGRGRKGNPELLQRILAEHDCRVHVVDPVKVQIGLAETLMVSSSLIRQLLGAGRVREAAQCLGRPYALVGDVIHGHGRGRPLGFPTANLSTRDQLIPAEGVYAGRAVWQCEPPPATERGLLPPLPTCNPPPPLQREDTEGPSRANHLRIDRGADLKFRPAAISIGKTPTFGGDELSVEAFVLDWDGDLYGSSLRLEFERFLRPQLRFDSPAALAEQVHRDVAAVRANAAESAVQSPGIHAVRKEDAITEGGP